MGTSHRRPGVRDLVGRLREGLFELFSLPEGFEVVLGNGGATAFWDAAVFGLIERRSQHLSFGEFSSKFANAVAGAPHLEAPMVIESAPGTHPSPEPTEGIDSYALTHNETSTGVTMPLGRVTPDSLTLVDATSAAAGIPVRAHDFDVYYFSPQKALAGDGGLFVALCSPAAVERIEALAGSGRWIPPFLDLSTALDNSRKNQTYNTPALATLYLLTDTIEWINASGGLAWSAGRAADNAEHLYAWADAHDLAEPFVVERSLRSPVTATIDFDPSVSADDLALALRANGIIDTEGYRKLGRNQLRIGLWPAIPRGDLEALTACLDYVIAAL